jgi:hypothetical protein
VTLDLDLNIRDVVEHAHRTRGGSLTDEGFDEESGRVIDLDAVADAVSLTVPTEWGSSHTGGYQGDL